jgi:hypothetical protein
MHLERVVLVLVCSVGFWSYGQFTGQTVVPRKTRPADFTVPVERRTLPNGLIVLLSPDDSVNEVAVDLTFGCGALRQPPGRAGLAHLVEHALASGPTPETDYQALLEARGATDFNGFTSMDRFGYSLVTPPEELSFTLWVQADRLGRRETLTTDASLARHRRIVMQEKLLRIEDASYGAATRMGFRYLFAKSHPLHEGVMGTAASLESITVADVNAFAKTCLLPNNAVLTLAGRFTVESAMAAITATLGRLPRGADLDPFPKTARLTTSSAHGVTEDVARRPRVTMLWTIPELGAQDAYALSLGATLLPVYTDGLNGMLVESDFVSNGPGGLFVLAVTTPRPLDPAEPVANADFVLRNLTFAPLPADVVAASYHLLDQRQLALLSSMAARASLIASLFRETGGRGELPSLDRHWRFSPEALHSQTAGFLKQSKVTVQSKPTRPLPPKRSSR